MAEEKFEQRLLFDFFVHESENLHDRVDWCLIFHAILFEAFLTAHSPQQRVTLGALGCIVSYVWLIAGFRQLWNIRHLVGRKSDRLIMGPDAAHLFTMLFDARRRYQSRWIKWAGATPAFCVVLPSALLVAWITVTATATIALGVVVIALLVLSALWWFIQERWPVVPAQAIEHLHPKTRTQDAN
jgi:hypothetical protein